MPRRGPVRDGARSDGDLRSTAAERTEVLRERHLAVHRRDAGERQALRIRLNDQPPEELPARRDTPMRPQHRVDGRLSLTDPSAGLFRENRRSDPRDRRQHRRRAIPDDADVPRERSRQACRLLPDCLEAVTLKAQ